ncbi:MAG TPA: hypothetical protein VKI19_06630 [Acidimicrobiales bacterium]|nr:hypothetical protein [Acidimicrobiales bacterium]
MHLSPVWFAPLAAGAAGAALLAGTAALVRREVSRLQSTLRPLRVRSRRRP